MKFYQTPQAVEAGEAADVVLAAKEIMDDDKLGVDPSDHYPPASVIDSDF